MTGNDLNSIKVTQEKKVFYKALEQLGEQQQLIDLLKKYALKDKKISEVINELELSNKELLIELDKLKEVLGIE